MSTRVVGVALIVTALAQGGLIWRHSVAASPPARPPLVFHKVGDRLETMRVVAEDGVPKAWAAGRGEARWTLVMSFRSGCAPSRSAAPAWRAWLEREHPVSAVAVTRDSIAAARRYRDAAGWKVPVISVNGAQRGTSEHLLVARTPWLFLVDPEGIVRFQADGTSLAAVDAFIALHVPPPPAS